MPQYDDFGNLLNPREEEAEEETEFTPDYFNQKACKEVKGAFGAGYLSNKAVNRRANKSVHAYANDIKGLSPEEGAFSDGTELQRSLINTRRNFDQFRPKDDKVLSDRQIYAEAKARAKAADAAERAAEAAAKRAAIAGSQITKPCAQGNATLVEAASVVASEDENVDMSFVCISHNTKAIKPKDKHPP